MSQIKTIGNNFGHNNSASPLRNERLIGFFLKEKAHKMETNKLVFTN